MNEIKRLRVIITGAVQGVGFRPFIYRLAKDHQLNGFINNSSQGVLIEVEGGSDALNTFLLSIEQKKPPHAFIQNLEYVYLDPIGFSEFVIQPSSDTGEKSVMILPDIATCPDCLKELFDPNDRRYLYPFTNCTNCGPRFTIIESLPYDRPNTTMKQFPMCDACLKEYADPDNRRFHAQPNACPVCGPHVEWWDASGLCMANHGEAVEQAALAIRTGKIVAVKGIGGFHLMADARNDEAVKELRKRKRREEKPFALMMPDLSAIESLCNVSDLERRLLLSPQAPIVLLEKTVNKNNLSGLIAPDNPYLGVMLPYSPLHHVLMRSLNIPVIATSGNISDEPICTDEREALTRLKGIADFFLVHNRPIVRHVDDSISRIILEREFILRRARGYAPLPVIIHHSETVDDCGLAVGAHLKNTIAINQKNRCFISQHIGDLDTAESYDAFDKVIGDLKSIYHLNPSITISDRHPDYASTRYAKEQTTVHVTLQHHVAHIISCMAENELEPPVLGVAWDGTGYGDDATIWGGEFILITDDRYKRAAHLRPFLLPGGDQAVREPRRSAIGLLHELFGENLNGIESPVIPAFSDSDLSNIKIMLSRRINCVPTSSAGRLFDAVASLIGLKQVCRFEGQAAMELEFIADQTPGYYEFAITKKNDTWIIDWEPMIRQIMVDHKNGVAPASVSSRFHNTLAEMIAETARKTLIESIALSGGCFQNKRLLESTIRRLADCGFKTYWHQRIPTNDGGIALGQITAALKYKHLLKRE